MEEGQELDMRRLVNGVQVCLLQRHLGALPHHQQDWQGIQLVVIHVHHPHTDDHGLNSSRRK